MTKNSKLKKRNTLLKKYPNLPTVERLSRGDMIIRNQIGQVDAPLRVDKLLRGGVIDEMQHLYAIQIITLWTIASRPFIRAMQYEPRTGGRPAGMEFIALSRMSAEDQYHKTMGFLRPRERTLIEKICFEEMAAIQAGRSLGLPVNSITSYVKEAFDALGNALAAMRDAKKIVEREGESNEG